MKAEQEMAINPENETNECEPEHERMPVVRKPGHYRVRVQGFPSVSSKEFSGENSWYEAQEFFRNSHGCVVLSQIFEGPRGMFEWCISSKRSSGRKILN